MVGIYDIFHFFFFPKVIIRIIQPCTKNVVQSCTMAFFTGITESNKLASFNRCDEQTMDSMMEAKKFFCLIFDEFGDFVISGEFTFFYFLFTNGSNANFVAFPD